MRNNKKIVIIIISIILIFALACGVFAYMYISTDMFRSDKELFAKYFSQNKNQIEKITKSSEIEVLKNLKNENNYNISTNAKMSYSNGGEISNPLNDLSVQLDFQKDKEKQYTYIDGQILYKDEKYLETELIKEQNVYGIRFKDIIEQFITVEKDENFESVMKDIGLTDEQLENLMNLFEKQEYETNEIDTLKNKYLDIIANTIENGQFSKQKNAVITYNDSTINTNAYIVTLTDEQVKNLLIEILSNIKNETEILQKLSDKESLFNAIDQMIENIDEEAEIPNVKITVYENKQKTIRTILEINEHNITIENIEQNKELVTKIKYLNSDLDQVIQVDIAKTSNENEEKIEINANFTKDNNTIGITLSNLAQISQENTKLDTKLIFNQGITRAEIDITNNVIVNFDFEKEQTLTEQNSRLINSINDEKRKLVIDQLKNLITQKGDEKIKILTDKMGLNGYENENNENEMSQTEINKFNSKFEFYTGEEVSAENVKVLLEVVKDNFKGYEFLNNEISEDTTNNTSNTTSNTTSKTNIKISIEKDKTNEEDINKILEKIDTNKKYQVSIKYSETNGLIDYITIIEK